jgi:hypothetical protein
VYILLSRYPLHTRSLIVSKPLNEFVQRATLDENLASLLILRKDEVFGRLVLLGFVRVTDVEHRTTVWRCAAA